MFQLYFGSLGIQYNQFTIWKQISYPHPFDIRMFIDLASCVRKKWGHHWREKLIKKSTFFARHRDKVEILLFDGSIQIWIFAWLVIKWPLACHGVNWIRSRFRTFLSVYNFTYKEEFSLFFRIEALWCFFRLSLLSIILSENLTFFVDCSVLISTFLSLPTLCKVFIRRCFNAYYMELIIYITRFSIKSLIS